MNAKGISEPGHYLHKMVSCILRLEWVNMTQKIWKTALKLYQGISMLVSVTRWLDYLFHIWPLTTVKIGLFQ